MIAEFVQHAKFVPGVQVLALWQESGFEKVKWLSTEFMLLQRRQTAEALQEFENV